MDNFFRNEVYLSAVPLLDRIFIRSAKHAVFYDVGHTRGIRRRGPESDIEDLVVIIIDEAAGTALYKEKKQ